MSQSPVNLRAAEEGAPNITLIRQTAEGLVRGDAFFRCVLEALPVAVYTTDAAGVITFYNEAAVLLWGHRPKLGEDLWCGSWKLFWPDGRPLAHHECPMAIALKEGRTVRDVEAIAERPDGTRVSFMPFPTPLFDTNGTLLGAVNMLMDLTDRKRAEQYRQRLALIVESCDDAIISKNLDGIITSWNRGAERLFGYTADEVIGMPIAILIPTERHDEEPRILDRIRHGERIDHYETIRRRKDGSLIEISLTVSPVRDAEGRVVGASKIARDITERRRAQEQQTLIVGEMKHRIKNILTTVQAIATQSLRKESGEDQKAFVGRLHALASAHDMLTAESWSRAPLRDVVVRVLEPFQEEHRDRLIIDGADRVWLNGDHSLLLALALHELATNAIKYGALSNRTGQVHIDWETKRNGQGDRVKLSWRESGGPLVRLPDQKGFGSRLIERAFASETTASRIEYAAQGVVCTLEIAV